MSKSCIWVANDQVIKNGGVNAASVEGSRCRRGYPGYNARRLGGALNGTQRYTLRQTTGAEALRASAARPVAGVGDLEMTSSPSAQAAAACVCMGERGVRGFGGSGG